MRVLYFVERFWPFIGGVEVMTARVLPELVRRGIELTIVTTQNVDPLPERDSFRGIDVRRLELDRAIRANDIDLVIEVRNRFAAIKQELRPDLMHVVFTGAAIFFPVKTAHIEPAPTLLSFHGSWPRLDLTRHTLLRNAVESATWLTACSDAALDDLKSLNGSVAARSTMIHNGLDAPARAPSPLSFDPPVLLCCARLGPEKGIDLAIDALHLLRPTFPALRLRIIGDGPVIGELVAQANRLGVADAVEFLGWRSPEDVPEHIDQSTIVVVPSRLEGFGLIALEGMLGARPVITSRAGGLPEVVGAEGVTFETGSAEGLAGEIAALLGDHRRAAQVGASGLARAQARFPLGRCVDAYESLYRELVPSRHAH